MTKATADPPAKTSGTDITRFNALKHGVLSQYTLLPWEDAAEYRDLLDALVAERRPEGPTEEHLVEEIAGVLWRKRRLRLAESAAFRRGLKEVLRPLSETAETALAHTALHLRHFGLLGDPVRAEAEDRRAGAVLDEQERRAERALRTLRRNEPEAYERALAALDEAARDWWEERLEPDTEEDWPDGEGEDEPYRPDAASLLDFLEEEAQPRRERRRAELQHRPLVRAQAFGEALDANSLERLARYEAHLDRKLERTLAMLLKLQDLRAGPAGG